MMVCSSPEDCEEIERRHSTGVGLLAGGGASRGNLLSGEAEETILTVSRMEAEKGANPGYRAFLADGTNVTKALVLFIWEVLLEWTAAIRAARRDVRPRGHRGRLYPFLRGALCVIVRDADRVRGDDRHHARAPGGVRHLLELRRGRAPLRPRARRHAGGPAQARRGVRTHRARGPLCAHGRTRSSSSQTTVRPRGRPSSSGTATGSTRSWSERSTGASRRASREATNSRRWWGMRTGGHRHQAQEAPEERRVRPEGGRARLGQPRPDLSDGGEASPHPGGDRRAPPRLVSTLREHPHVGWLLVDSTEHGALVLGARGSRGLESGKVEGEDPLAPFPQEPGSICSARTGSLMWRT